MTRHSHRQSSLRQTNKPFKGSQKNKKKKKKTDPSVLGSKSIHSHVSQSKHQRIFLKQQERNRKMNIQKEKQRLGASSGEVAPPKIVLLLPMTENINAWDIKKVLLEVAGVNGVTQEGEPVTFLLPSWCRSSLNSQDTSFHLTLVDVNPYKPKENCSSATLKENDSNPFCSTEMLHRALDLAKVAHVVVFLFSKPNCTFDDPPFDPLAYQLMSALRLQGMPTPVGVLVASEEFRQLSDCKKKENVKLIQRFFISEFGNDKKFMVLDSPAQNQNVLRGISNSVPKNFPWRDGVRGYLMTERCQLHSNVEVTERGTLILEGYCRGVGFSVKHPIHITGIGDFILERIYEISPPHYNRPKLASPVLLEALTSELEADLINEWKPLRPFNELEGDKTWPTEQEINAAAQNKNRHKKIGCLGTGFKMICSDSDTDQLAEGDSLHGTANEEEEEDVEFDSVSNKSPQVELSDDVSSGSTDDSFDRHGALDLSNHLFQPRLKTFTLEERSREDMEFPDEIDICPTVEARERLQQYRGLKSFRCSRWDPYENLPNEYSRIYEFDSFNASTKYGRQIYQNDCLALNDNSPITGKYLRLEIRLCYNDVSEAAKAELVQKRLGDQQSQKYPFIISSLLPHERKITVCHAMLHHQDGYTHPLASKTPVLLQFGFRRFLVRPIYSRIGSRSVTCLVPHKATKLKFERFFHPNTTVFATFYGPTIYPGAPALMMSFPSKDVESLSFRSLKLPEQCAIAAWGNGIPPSPLRVLVKRIVLTGYPFRVHKRKAVVRYMFFNAADVRWFKPVELCTKKGLRGHIKEPLGTHGYMKCIFSEPLDQSDTVCMHLYKRVFPKWFPLSWGDITEASFNVA